MDKLRIAIVCDWLTDWGGAERVILALHKLYPEAPIYTSIYDKDHLRVFDDADVRTSFLQKFPGAKRHHQRYITLMPAAFESFDLSGFDIVISSSHACAKGVITKPETLHLSYCHSPPRYLWDNSHEYIKNYPWPKWLKKFVIPGALHKLRIWDRAAADRVDRYISNSHYISGRINKYYRREAKVIYPPVEMDAFKKVKKE
ncbi:MAG: glycosyltransferase, partial [Candidatus Peregrinibacteria bacterium]|nr:glycosyltransferase [Candidatus Peregrinibacteria bacterium]